MLLSLKNLEYVDKSVRIFCMIKKIRGTKNAIVEQTQIIILSFCEIRIDSTR